MTHRAGTPSFQLINALWDESHPWLLKALSVGENLVSWQGIMAHSYEELWHHGVGLLYHKSKLPGTFFGPCPESVKLGKVQVLFLQLCISRHRLQTLLLAVGPLPPAVLSWSMQFLGATGILSLMDFLFEGKYKANTKAAWESLRTCFHCRASTRDTWV